MSKSASVVFLSQSSILLLLIVGLIPTTMVAQAQGPRSVPVPLPPPSHAASAAKKTRGSFPPVPTFKDIAAQVGITVSHIAAPEAHYVIDSTSGGVGLFDCDNDGRLDVVLVNGSTVERLRGGGDPMVTLYHQEPDGTFKNITNEAGLTRLGWGMGVAVADYDNDGKLDLFVTGYNGNVLYHNLGNCKFEDVTDKAGVRGGGFSTGAAWGDYDRDGRVDLFVPRYVHEDLNALPETHANGTPCMYLAVRVLCGPDGLTGESDFLFHNRGDGTFEEVAQKAGVDDPGHRFGMQALWADFENDGWPDLYVANDTGANYLYRNKHDGTFEDVGLESGAALTGDGRLHASMGVDVADIDHSGRYSIMVTNFSQEGASLFYNLGKAGFDDISSSAGLLLPTFPYVGWGTAFFDVDNDGWPDIFVANGHAYPQMESVKGGVPYREPLLLFRNNRDRTFENATVLSGLDR